MHIRPCHLFTVALSDCSSINKKVAFPSYFPRNSSIIGYFVCKEWWNHMQFGWNRLQENCNIFMLLWLTLTILNAWEVFQNLEISHWYEFPSEQCCLLPMRCSICVWNVILMLQNTSFPMISILLPIWLHSQNLQSRWFLASSSKAYPMIICVYLCKYPLIGCEIGYKRFHLNMNCVILCNIGL